MIVEVIMMNNMHYLLAKIQSLFLGALTYSTQSTESHQPGLNIFFLLQPLISQR